VCPLHIAARMEYLKIAKLLIKNGADITIKNARGKTALDIAKDINTNHFLYHKMENENIKLTNIVKLFEEHVKKQ